jgi:hypothetical protein|nr:MAG TPA: hypothetical protein [Caudoviricetes sp.]
MAKIDLDKMVSTYAKRAIFQLKMKVKQNKLLGNIGYLEFTDTSSQVDYTEGIVKASVVITDGINIIDTLNVKLAIEQVYNNGILKIPNAVKEADRIGKMIDKCISKLHNEKDITYRETLPFIITQSVPGCSKLQGKILLPSKDSEKWNTKAMLFHLLNNRIIGLLYANHDMVVGKIEEADFGWRGNNKSTFYLNCNIDYELKKCKVRISIPFNKADQGFSLYTSMFRLEEIVDQVAEQLRKQVPVNVVEKTSKSKPSKKVTNKEVATKETEKDERFLMSNVLLIEERPKNTEPLSITLAGNSHDSVCTLMELWMNTSFTNLLLKNPITAPVIDDISYTVFIKTTEKDGYLAIGNMEIKVALPGLKEIIYRAKVYTFTMLNGLKFYPQEDGMNKVVQVLADKIKERENGK